MTFKEFLCQLLGHASWTTWNDGVYLCDRCKEVSYDRNLEAAATKAEYNNHSWHRSLSALENKPLPGSWTRHTNAEREKHAKDLLQPSSKHFEKVYGQPQDIKRKGSSADFKTEESS